MNIKGDTKEMNVMCLNMTGLSMLGMNATITIPNNHRDEMISGFLVSKILKDTPQKNAAIKIITEGIANWR